MRQQFIPYTTIEPEHEDAAKTIAGAWIIAPWAAEIVEVEGGFLAFESATDYETWINQV